MLNAYSSNYQAEEPFRAAEGFGIPLEFNNASDYLFARLFLNDDPTKVRIPFEYCEAILSTLQDPRFDSRKVTFKDWGDVCCRVGEYRDKAWSLVETRGRGYPTGMPQVVLDGVFDVMSSALKNLCLAKSTKNTLKNMALVHTSWHGRSRRALGYAVACIFPIRNALNVNAIQDPSIGRWTRELRVKVDHQDRLQLPVSNQLHHLRLLCSRISQVRRLDLGTSTLLGASRLFADEVIRDIYESISPLTHVTELHLHVPYIPSILIQFISEAHRKTLKSLVFNTWDHAFEKASFPDTLSPLAPLPKLDNIYFIASRDSMGYSGIRAPLPTVTDILWTRKSSEQGDFCPKEISIQCLSELHLTTFQKKDITEKAGTRTMLRSATSIEFFVHEAGCSDADSLEYPSEQEMADAIVPALKSCTSARKLSFRGFSWSHMKIFELFQDRAGMPSCVKELHIVSSLPKLPPKEPDIKKALEHCSFSPYDIQLALALALGLAPGLQSLNVLFTTYRGVARKKSDNFDYLLPRCRRKCVERGISFSIGIEA